MNKTYRQGDVLIELITSSTKKLTRNKKTTLAFGEVTGHAHVIDSPVESHVGEDGLATEFEVMQAMAYLTHEEHDPIALPRGVYRVIHQVEYTPKAIVRVAD